MIYKNNYLHMHIFERLSSMTDDGFIVVNRSGEVIHINDKYCDFLGTTREKALGKSIFNIIPSSKMLEVMENRYCEECVTMNYTLGTEKENRAIVSRSYVENEDGEVIAGVAQVKFRLQTLDVAQKIMKEYVELEYYKEQYLNNTQRICSFTNMVGNSKAFTAVKRIGMKASKTNFPVLITGKTGTGKEVFAQAIHANSTRGKKLMVSINCAAIPEDLLESELFGYEEGSFTGAKKGGKKGKFYIADGGTIFLDEIGDMPLSMQGKLLRVLQEKEIDPIGSVKPVKIDVRVIAATRKNLTKMIEEGLFREDLYYRLNVINIEMPSLSERKEDILDLANFFLNKLNVEYKTVTGFSKEVKKCLYEYNWPGNIRELDNVIKSAYAINDDFLIELKDLPAKIIGHAPTLSESDSSTLQDMMEKYEKNILIRQLKNNHWNCRITAEKIGIHKSVLYKKIKKYAIERD